jgi:hypothetical protein
MGSGRALLVAAALVLIAAGCGDSQGSAAKPRRAETTTHQPRLYATSLRVFFCTKATCSREATQSEMAAARGRALGSPLISRVRFVSKAAFRRAHPDGFAGAGLMPPYPNSLIVVPTKTATAAKVSELFGHGDPRLGVARVFYNYAFR